MGAEIVLVEGWGVTFEDDGKPRIRDIELAERAGYAQPRQIRELIKRNRTDLERKEPLLQRRTVRRYESRPGIEQVREGDEFLLTRAQAFVLVPLMGVKDSGPLLVEMAYVFDAALDGRLNTASLHQSVVQPILSKVAALIAESQAAVDAAADRRHQEALSRLDENRPRRPLSSSTKREHIEATIAFGGFCSCCGRVKVLDGDGNVLVGENGLPVGDFDHFFTPWQNAVHETWLICKKICHADFNARRAHDHKITIFRAYQEKRQEFRDSKVPAEVASKLKLVATQSKVESTQPKTDVQQPKPEAQLVLVPTSDDSVSQEEEKRHWAQGGQSGKKIDDLEMDMLTDKELKMISAIRSVPSITLRQWAYASFGGHAGTDATSWIRNGLRKLVCGGWVEKVDRGTYSITDLGRLKSN